MYSLLTCILIIAGWGGPPNVHTRSRGTVEFRVAGLLIALRLLLLRFQGS